MPEEPEDEEFDELEDDMSEEERAVLDLVVKAGDRGILSEEIAKKLKMPVEKVEEILEKFYSSKCLSRVMM